MTEQEQLKQDEKKEEEQKQILHRNITVTGKDLPISTKHSIAICRFIRNRKVDDAVSILQDVSNLKKAVPMKGELPHRKGMDSGRYPKNASKAFIRLLKNLKANASNLGVDASSLVIHAKSNLASRRRFSRRAQNFKRTDVFIELKQK
jgi:ribosomal protein L22